MRLLRTFLVLLSVGTFAVSASACGDDDSADTDPTPVTGTTPQEVEEPGEGDDVPTDPNTPATGNEGETEPGPGAGGDQNNPY